MQVRRDPLGTLLRENGILENGTHYGTVCSKVGAEGHWERWKTYCYDTKYMGFPPKHQNGGVVFNHEAMSPDRGPFHKDGR